MLRKMFDTNNRSIILSYWALRKLIGILGMSLPVICIIGGAVFAHTAIQDSISQYYHTNMRDFFVGLMFCVALFLVTYKGRRQIDNVITIIIGIAAFGTALFPGLNSNARDLPVGIFHLEPATSNVLHLTSAVSFFILLAINSFALFPSPEDKKRRNFMYKLCGVIIIISLIMIAILHKTIGHEGIAHYKIILLFESIMLFAFGVSWLVKGLRIKA